MMAAFHTGAGRPSRTSTHGAAMNSLSEQCTRRGESGRQPTFGGLDPFSWDVNKMQPLSGVTHMADEREDTTIYKVVVNHEEQYSIWPADRENALGWKDAGKQGLKAECLAYIKEVWTDMRPLSLRKKMEEQALKN